jgi:hypothetical protein
MNALQVQINEINQKVDQLREIVQQLGNHLTVVSTADVATLPALAPVIVPERVAVASRPVPSPLPESKVSEHKDIISDEYMDSSFFFPGSDAFMTADIQICRLTAQLTAAYNRIAALEEQLIARRTRN